MTDPESLFRGDRPIPGCRSTTITIPPADRLDYSEADWAGAVVVVLRGRLHLECWSGEQGSFDEGTVLFLTGLDLRYVTNFGLDPLVLKTITRVA
ncbi:hypothetical protein [Cryptosporangium phraense]|uniref:hypothetical protein n=1 Tax=Cryptosporangium phraense TaxID=2593070 RepID=UPI00147897E6|nr:hypothetical protein [Cryptosporangium phraense]